MSFLFKVKKYDKLRPFLIWLVTPKKTPRPRFWVRWFVNPIIFKVGKGAEIHYMRARLDLFPWHKFEIGKNGIIEDYEIGRAHV